MSQQFSLDVALRPFATFDTFVSPEDNELLPLLKDLAQASNEPRQFFIWGADQTGKSHLLQAICNLLAGTKQKAFYISFKELVGIDTEILAGLHQLDVICIDDVDRVLGKKEWDQALFQLINEMRMRNKSLVMTATHNPSKVNLSFPDLASRLPWGPVYKLNHLTDQQKEIALQWHAKARGFEISADVCSFLLKRYPRELTKLVDILEQLDQQSLAQQRKVTVPFVKSILEETMHS